MLISQLRTLGAEVVRDGEFNILSSIDSKYPGSLVFAENEYYIEKALKNSFITSLIVPRQFEKNIPPCYGLIINDDVRSIFYHIHNNIDKIISKSHRLPTTIGDGCNISSMAVIDSENVIIGNNVTIEEFVTIRGPVVIGDNTVLRAGVRVGSDGFQFPRNKDGKPLYVKHYGGVTIGADVEIKENVIINCGLFFEDRTRIGDGTKIDGQCSISHNVIIKKNCLIAPGVTICGSVTIGDNVWIGPQATISSEVSVSDGARILIGSVVIRNVKAEAVISGNFAVKHEDHLRKNV